MNQPIEIADVLKDAVENDQVLDRWLEHPQDIGKQYSSLSPDAQELLIKFFRQINLRIDARVRDDRKALDRVMHVFQSSQRAFNDMRRDLRADNSSPGVVFERRMIGGCLSLHESPAAESNSAAQGDKNRLKPIHPARADPIDWVCTGVSPRISFGVGIKLSDLRGQTYFRRNR